MKINKSYFLSAFSVAALVLSLISVHVFAATTPTGPATASPQSANGPLTIPTDPEQTTTIEQRLAQRKATLKVQLSQPAAQRLASKCTLAQTAIGVQKTKEAASRGVRTQAYTNIANRMNNLIQNISHQGYDISDLGALQQQVNTSMNKYLVDVQAYKTAMDDLVTVDCQKDPLGFDVTLVDARNLRATLASDTSIIKNHISNLPKTFATIKKSLAKGGN